MTPPLTGSSEALLRADSQQTPPDHTGAAEVGPLFAAPNIPAADRLCGLSLMPRVWLRPPHGSPHLWLPGSPNAAHNRGPLAEPTPGRHLPLRAVSVRGTARDPTRSAGTPTTPGTSSSGSSHFDLLSRKPTGVTHSNNNNNSRSRINYKKSIRRSQKRTSYLHHPICTPSANKACTARYGGPAMKEMRTFQAHIYGGI